MAPARWPLRWLQAIDRHRATHAAGPNFAYDLCVKRTTPEQRAALAAAAGQAFYNTSRFTLRDLKSRASQQQLLADFEDYLDGFSPNVQDILENFKFRNQLPTLSKADALGTLINKFLDPDIDLSPAGIDNHAMGTVFEELVRKFNEDNNEEAGEHWTPRDAVRLMANLVFLPVENQLKSGTYLLYDDACGTGGMLGSTPETLICFRFSMFWAWALARSAASRATAAVRVLSTSERESVMGSSPEVVGGGCASARRRRRHGLLRNARTSAGTP